MNNPSFEDALSRVISEDMSLSEKLICVWDETVNQWTAENLFRVKYFRVHDS